MAPSGAVEGNVAAAMGWEEGRRGQLMMEGTDEEWDADVEAEAEEEEDEELVAMELAPPCGAFPTFVWGGKPSYLEGQGVYETRRWVSDGLDWIGGWVEMNV